jgi:hypothetical protein
MNILEEFCICTNRRSENQTNDKCTTKPNILFDTIILNTNDRERPQQ